jgi:hypothetical protein
VAYDALEKLIRGLKLPSLEALEYVTTYRGKPLEKGQKSLTTTLAFRSPTATLTSEQVEGSVQQVVQAAQRELGATLRTLCFRRSPPRTLIDVARRERGFWRSFRRGSRRRARQGRGGGGSLAVFFAVPDAENGEFTALFPLRPFRRWRRSPWGRAAAAAALQRARDHRIERLGHCGADAGERALEVGWRFARREFGVAEAISRRVGAGFVRAASA